MIRKSKGFVEFAILTVLFNSACGSSSPTPQSPNTAPKHPSFRGDWSQASNLAESLFDIQKLGEEQIIDGFRISYYDLDDEAKIKPLKTLHLYLRARREGALDSDDSRFDAGLTCTDSHCLTGQIQLRFQGGYGSIMSGQVRVDFNQSEMVTFSKKIDPTTLATATEASFIQTLSTHALQNGAIEQFRVKGGLANPFRVMLFFSSGEIVSWHGNLGLDSRTVVFEENNNSNPEPSTVRFPNPHSIEICYGKNRSLQGIGAYGSLTHADPTHLCE